MRFIRSRHAIPILLGVALLAGLGSSIARNVGQNDGAAARQRLEIVWPNLMQMRDQDRALLASLALTCQLHNRGVDRASVLECLTEAVDDEDAILPNGMDRKQAKARLGQLSRTGV